MPHGGPGLGGFGGGHGIGHGGLGGPGPGAHGFHGGFGMHSGGPPGFVGRGGYSPGHHDDNSHESTDNQPTFSQTKPRPSTANPKFQQSTQRTSSQTPGKTKLIRRSKVPPRPESQSNPSRKLHDGATHGTSKYLSGQFHLRLTLVAAILSLTLCGSMVMSNILAAKLWHIGPIHLDGGFILFPLTYIVTDVMVELFYRKFANAIVFCCCGVSFICYTTLNLTIYLPATPDVTTVEPSAALGISARIMFASAIAIIISTLVNNRVYDYMRRYEASNAVSQKSIKRRAWFSSFFAHIPDSLLFTLLAFHGMASFKELCYQMTTSYLAGLAVETLLLPLTGFIAFSLRQCLDEFLYAP